MEYGSLPYGISYPLTDVFASTLVPAIPGSLRGRAPQRGSRGLAPWPQRSAPPALARKDGERFGERKGTHRSLRLIIGPSYLAPLSLFRLQLHRGLKTIDIDPQRPVQFGQLSVARFSSEAIIADHLAHNLPVLLFDVALIVASSRTSSGKGDVFLLTENQQLHVDKLCSVVCVDAQQRKGKKLLGSLECSNDRLLTTIEKWETFCPSGSNVSQGQRIEVRSLCLSTTMGHKIGFHEARLGLIPILERADRDLLFEQRS